MEREHCRLDVSADITTPDTVRNSNARKHSLEQNLLKHIDIQKEPANITSWEYEIQRAVKLPEVWR